MAYKFSKMTQQYLTTAVFSNELLPLNFRTLHWCFVLPVSPQFTTKGRDFLAYRTDDDAVAQAFLLLPARCVSRISRVASARATIADHNIGLLCNPGIASLWLRGRFTDEVCSDGVPC